MPQKYKNPHYKRDWWRKKSGWPRGKKFYGGRKAAVRRYRYGLEPEDYERMLHAQGGACAVCKNVKRLIVDHNHDTGKVRGLLCQGCNFGMGHFRDDCERMESAIIYLKERV